MLTRVLLTDADLAGLSTDERLAVEYLLRAEMSEVARRRRSGDSALLLAVAAAEVYEQLLHRTGPDAADVLTERVRSTPVGRLAQRRVRAVAALTAA